jgi:hypothetical protein
MSLSESEYSLEMFRPRGRDVVKRASQLSCTTSGNGFNLTSVANAVISSSKYVAAYSWLSGLTCVPQHQAHRLSLRLDSLSVHVLLLLYLFEYKPVYETVVKCLVAFYGNGTAIKGQIM